MVPMFACCAMQSSYAMIMLCHRTREAGLANVFDEGLQLQTSTLLLQLTIGLQLILTALKNYALAYEAIGGMRGAFPIVSG